MRVFRSSNISPISFLSPHVIRLRRRAPVTKKELVLLGEIAFYTSHIEYHLHQVLWHLLEVNPKRGMAITGPMQFNQKVDLLLSLIEEMPEKDHALISAAKMIEKARPERNRKLHAFWIWEGKTRRKRAAILLSSNRRLFKLVPVSYKDIEEARDITILASGLLNSWLWSKNLMGKVSMPFE